MKQTARLSTGYALIVAVALFGLLAVPFNTANALSPADPPAPPAPGPFRGEKLELAWARARFIHDRMSVLFEHADQRLTQAQTLIDRAKSRGKDVTALQTALDALESGIQAARPTFEGMTGIIAAHQGFDANGRVTDLSKAIATVQSMADKIRTVRTLVGQPARDFREAVREFRQANASVPTPGG